MIQYQILDQIVPASLQYYPKDKQIDYLKVYPETPNRQALIVDMIIKVKDQQHHIEVRDQDDPHQLAQQFCKKHTLGQEAIFVIEKKIKEHLNQYQSERSKLNVDISRKSHQKFVLSDKKYINSQQSNQTSVAEFQVKESVSPPQQLFKIIMKSDTSEHKLYQKYLNESSQCSYQLSRKDSAKQIQQSMQKIVKRPSIFSQYQDTKTNQKSNQIVLQKQIRKLQEIFNLLDSNKDGLISTNLIDLTQISDATLQNLQQFFIKMEQKNQVYDFAKFSDKIIKCLNVKQKNELFNDQNWEKNHSISTIEHPYKKKEKKKLEYKQQNEEKEFKECSFKPVVNKKYKPLQIFKFMAPSKIDASPKVDN